MIAALLALVAAAATPDCAGALDALEAEVRALASTPATEARVRAACADGPLRARALVALGEAAASRGEAEAAEQALAALEQVELGDDVRLRQRALRTTVRGLAGVLAEERRRHPALEAADLYKLLHQSVRGPGHAVPSAEAAGAWLRRELEGLGPPREGEARVQVLDPELGWVRVHLRPWAAEGGEAAELLLADFVRSAGLPTPGVTALAARAGWVAHDLATLAPGVDADAFTRLLSEAAEEGWPAVHHGERYREAHAPAYRVVEAEAPSATRAQAPAGG